MRQRNRLTNAAMRVRAMQFLTVATVILFSAAGVASGAVIPVFYNSLDSDTAVNADNYWPGTGGTVQNTANHAYTAGVSGNAFQSTVTGTNNTNSGGWARWNDSAINSIFSGWDNSNGITFDLYFQGVYSTVTTGTANEGLWALVRRNSAESGLTGGDNYVFASVQSTAALPGRLRIAFANNTTNNQYKFTFNGNAAVPASQEFAPGVDIPLSDNTPYHLTVSIGNGEFKVWLDDLNGSQYSNAAPVFTDNTVIPDGFNWQLPATGNVASSGSMAGRQTREMDIGIRGFGNTGNTINNFGGSLRSGNWIDEVSVYNGVYSPADLAVPEPSTVCLVALGLLVSQVVRRRS